MPEDANLSALKQREKMLTEKIVRLKSGEMNCEEFAGDGRQEEAIIRNEKYLRDVKKAIVAIEKPKVTPPLPR